MTSASALTDSAAEPVEAWNTRALIVRHKWAAGTGLVLLVLLLVIIIGGLVSARPVAVSDTTTCTAWGSANQTQQQAYALRYVREHGALKSGATDPASVIATINNGCGQAYVNDVEDSVNVVQAIQHQY